MRYLIFLSLLFTACTAEPIHQGNRLDINQITQLKQGDTRFHVEQLLGSPVLQDTLHPNRSVYYEEFKDDSSGEMLKRSLIITYDDAKRIIKLERSGLKKQPTQHKE
ncbi:MAG: outer membrane protein assembly factor BamE [Mariprofundus sp.]|nr:outer membrane protein assembly factor BamE [Mariprofundus sp.]